MVAEAEDAGGDAPRVNLACAASRWPVGLGCEVLTLVEVRRGQKLLRAGGGAPWVNGLVATAGSKGARVTSGLSRVPLRGLKTLPLSPDPEILSSRSRRPDSPAATSWGRWVSPW